MAWPYFVATSVVAVVIVSMGWGWFEAGWLRTRLLEVPHPRLPARLDGLRIAHLSDFHLGHIGRGRVATERAVAWVERRRPDLVVVTGDLVSRASGETPLRGLLSRLGCPYVVLGNHDVAVTRDPFSQAVELEDIREHAVLLRDETVTVELASTRVQIVGVDASTYPLGSSHPEPLGDPSAEFRILLCHFPGVVHRLPEGAFDLVLAGHLHAGQIAIPSPFGRFPLAHPRAPYLAGLYETPTALLHVSPGTGTTFVPFRFCARPEVTELRLRRA
jgi:uncharacterized protein